MKIIGAIEPLAETHSCSHCAMREICLPLGVDRSDLVKLENLVQSSAVFEQADTIIRQGDKFSKVYAVKSGTLKSTRIDQHGNHHIIGFHLPGELIGLDGIYPEMYPSEVSALEATTLCEMDYDKLSELCVALPALQKQLLKLLSRDIYESNVATADSAERTAEQKVAGFIKNLSSRYEHRGYPADNLKLAMTRQDIANHLNLTPETVSRVLKRLKQHEVVQIENKQIRIICAEKLVDILAGCPIHG